MFNIEDYLKSRKGTFFRFIGFFSTILLMACHTYVKPELAVEENIIGIATKDSLNQVAAQALSEGKFRLYITSAWCRVSSRLETLPRQTYVEVNQNQWTNYVTVNRQNWHFLRIAAHGEYGIPTPIKNYKVRKKKNGNITVSFVFPGDMGEWFIELHPKSGNRVDCNSRFEGVYHYTGYIEPL